MTIKDYFVLGMHSPPVNYIEQFVCPVQYILPAKVVFPCQVLSCQVVFPCFLKFPMEGPIRLYSNMASSFRVFPYFFTNTRSLSTIYVKAPPTATPL